jgi:hypothetical protein
LISAAFPAIAAVSSSLPFVFFGGMMVLQFVLVTLYLPETMGLTLESLGQTMETSTPQ